MGGTLPICPFCKKELSNTGLKDHIKAKHPGRYPIWRDNGMLPYWMYNDNGELKNELSTRV